MLDNAIKNSQAVPNLPVSQKKLIGNLETLLKRLGKYDEAMELLAHHGILRLNQVLAKDKTRGVVLGRRKLIFMLRKWTTMSTVEIGSIMGLDPTSVGYALRGKS